MANFMGIQRLAWDRKVQVANRKNMKAAQSHRPPAFTVIELLVMIFTVTMLLVLLFSGVPRVRKQARLKQCFSNLKHISLAFRIWHYGLPTTSSPQRLGSEGGTMESMLDGQIFPTFQVISNELGNPKLLVCPSDNRAPATNFSGVTNVNVSYFFGVDASDQNPYLFLCR
jgi:competence protein ComGC